jgi:hypothetical protein
MYNPAKGSEPEQVPPDVDEGAGVGCSSAVPGGSILRSPSSPATNVEFLVRFDQYVPVESWVGQQ